MFCLYHFLAYLKKANLAVVQFQFIFMLVSGALYVQHLVLKENFSKMHIYSSFYYCHLNHSSNQPKMIFQPITITAPAECLAGMLRVWSPLARASSGLLAATLSRRARTVLPAGIDSGIDVSDAAVKVRRFASILSR